VVARKYYYAGGSRLAMREAGKLSYLLTDHLGSTAVVADMNGVRTSEARYKAWGETRYAAGTLPTTYKFTGQREEQSLELYFYNARYYDPALGRFAQADSVVPESQGVQAFDRYAYSSGNPVKYIDPTGHRSCSMEEAATGDETCVQNYPINESGAKIHLKLVGTDNNSPRTPKEELEPGDFDSLSFPPTNPFDALVRWLVLAVYSFNLYHPLASDDMLNVYIWAGYMTENGINTVLPIQVNNYSNSDYIFKFAKVSSFDLVNYKSDEFWVSSHTNGVTYLQPGTSYVPLYEDICQHPSFTSLTSVEIMAKFYGQHEYFVFFNVP
jgi:RHS repeat-associated protein